MIFISFLNLVFLSLDRIRNPSKWRHLCHWDSNVQFFLLVLCFGGSASEGRELEMWKTWRRRPIMWLTRSLVPSWGILVFGLGKGNHILNSFNIHRQIILFHLTNFKWTILFEKFSMSYIWHNLPNIVIRTTLTKHFHWQHV